MSSVTHEDYPRLRVPGGEGSRRVIEPGDRMDQPSFHAWYETVPEDFKAELLEGVVYMPAAARNPHSSYHSLIALWLGYYAAHTPGTTTNTEPTVVLGPRHEPQPDATLRILGGQTSLDERQYIVGPPELIVEVAASSRTYDLHVKKDVYESSGVQEYVVLVIEEPKVLWFDRGSDGRYAERSPNENGDFDSRVFPGLRLDVQAVLRNDALQVLTTLQAALAEPGHSEFVKSLPMNKFDPQA